MDFESEHGRVVVDSTPKWESTEAQIACEGGPKVVPALTNEWCPGLAVTMAMFGLFRVTHIASGRAIGGEYERAANATLELVKWAAVAKAAGFSWAGSAEEVQLAVKACADMPVPFVGATSTGADGTRPLTFSEWRRTFAFPWCDEFPFEEESPTALMLEILATLAPPAPAA